MKATNKQIKAIGNLREFCGIEDNKKELTFQEADQEIKYLIKEVNRIESEILSAEAPDQFWID